MINRCYNVNSTEYPHYGAVNTTVCERWHCFVNFANDIENIEGYDEDLFEENLIQLDKDGKQMFSQAKVYSPETFQFITPYQNGQLVERERISITSVSPQGVEESWDSVSEFLKYHPSMKRAGVYKCLSKHLYTYRGWRFGYCNDYRKPDESE